MKKGNYEIKKISLFSEEFKNLKKEKLLSNDYLNIYYNIENNIIIIFNNDNDLVLLIS